ncbi:MAG: hypothetical protein R6U35_00320 [Candidatus Humimicrobiaceae bacterium]
MIKIGPAPLAVTEVIMANIGGSATLVGDSPNVVLGLRLGFYFNDFVIKNGLISLVAGLQPYLYIYCIIKWDSIAQGIPQYCRAKFPTFAREAIEDMRQLKIS